MSTTFTTELSSEDAKYKAEIEKIFSELEHVFKQMRDDHEEIERSQVVTNAMIEQLLTQLGMA